MLKVSAERREQVNKQFSENALKIMRKRYLLEHEDGTQETPSDLYARVADALSLIEKKYGKDEEFHNKVTQDFFDVMSSKEFTPAGRTLTNAGANSSLVANCIVLPIHDSMESIFQTLKDAALLQQAGSGLGFDLSELRPADFMTKRSRGRSSGPVSFLRVYDAAFGTIKQQGRHGANMAMMRVDHPDIVDFIHCKNKEGQIRNFNITVTITDEFMRQLQEDPKQLWFCTYKGEKYKPRKVIRHANGVVKGAEEINITVGELFDEIVESAWTNGEPGIAFIDTVNRTNPLPGLGPIASCNPCVTGDTLVSTGQGFLSMKELAESQALRGIALAQDSRVPKMKIVRVAKLAVAGTQQEGIEYQDILSFERSNDALPGILVKAWKTGVKPVYRLTTRSGYELKLTKDHEVFTPAGKVPFGELKKGDTILLQSQEGVWNTQYQLPFVPENIIKGKNGHTYSYNFPSQWSKELGQVLGWLVGDGWLRDKPKEYMAGFTFAKEDVAVLAYLRGILNDWYHNSAAKERQRDNGVYHLTYGSKSFVEYLKKLGVKPVRAAEKEIPAALWYAPREAVVGFLQALFSADGTINIVEKNQTRYIRLTSKSQKLLKQVQLLLLNLGIRSSLYNRSRKPSYKMGYQNDGVCFELQITRTNISRFLEKIGFLGNHYTAKVQTLASLSYYEERFEDEVKEVAYEGVKEVYDLTELLTHSFIANGIVISNCGEQFLHAYDNCNLGSINLERFVRDGEIDFERLRFVTETATRMLDNVIDLFDFPVDRVTDFAKQNRRIGLGIMGFGDMLFQMGIPYNSSQGQETAGKVMQFIQEVGHEASEKLAEEKGEFPNHDKSVFANSGIKRRNAAVTTVAPTGSVSMMFDVSSGIEPNFALAYVKQDKDGHQYHYFNKYFEKALDELQISSEEKDGIMQEVIEKGTIQHLDNLPKELRDTFVISMDISGQDHMKMQAAFQAHVDNSISKTINLPNSATKEEVAESFISAFKMGCKSCTVYRDGSRVIQVLNIGNGDKVVSITEDPVPSQQVSQQITETPPEKVPSRASSGQAKIIPRKRPEVMAGKTYRMQTGYGKLYITVNNDEKGVPFEIFATIGKSGGFYQEQSEAICRLVSMALRSGIEVQEVVGHLKGIRGPSPIFTEKGTILSIPDALGKVLEEHVTTTNQIQEVIERPENQEVLPFHNQDQSIADYGFMPGCPECGSPLVMAEGCISCKSCGFSRCG